jgi:hypothetical protein
MANFNRTANSAYYASKQELKISGTREGSKTPKVVPSYRHTSSDTNTSANKYYASVAAKPGTPKPAKLKAAKHVQLICSDNSIVQSIIEELSAGAARITVRGSAEELTKAKLHVDLAVGRNTLTRTQADQVDYAIKVTTVPVPETKTETVEEIPPVKITEEPETAVTSEEITEEDVAAAFGVTSDDDGDDDDIEDDANAL